MGSNPLRYAQPVDTRLSKVERWRRMFWTFGLVVGCIATIVMLAFDLLMLLASGVTPRRDEWWLLEGFVVVVLNLLAMGSVVLCGWKRASPR